MNAIYEYDYQFFQQILVDFTVVQKSEFNFFIFTIARTVSRDRMHIVQNEHLIVSR